MLTATTQAASATHVPASIQSAIRRYAAHARGKGLTEQTVGSYLSKLKVALEPALGDPPAGLTAEHMEALKLSFSTRARLRAGARYNEATIRIYWYVTTKFARWYQQQGWVAADPTKGGGL